MSARRFTFTVAPEDAGLRLDQLLAKRVPGMSRRTARKVLEIGGVFVERARIKFASKFIQPGRKVEVNMGGALEEVLAAEETEAPTIDVVFEDEHLLVVDKPAQLMTAPTPESDRHNLLYYLEQRPASEELHLVHRLDQSTSGLMVVAKNPASARELSEAFRSHSLERLYRTVLLGDLGEAKTVDAPIEGRPASTNFSPVEHKAGFTLADARLQTGRTHQVRVHAQHLGNPVLGDRRYGQPTDHDPPRLALHARVLGFTHPSTAQPLRFEREWPADLADWWRSL